MSIEVQLRYCIDTGEKPATETVGPGGRLRSRCGGEDDWRRVELHDAPITPPRLGDHDERYG